MGLKHLGDIMANVSFSKNKKKSNKHTLGQGSNNKEKAAEIKLGTWKKLIGGKVVGVDISVLFHSLFGDKTEVRQFLSVNPEASVFYFVGQRMNRWFKDRHLFYALAIIFVHDPKLVNNFHCESCEQKFKDDIAVKYDVSGRNATSERNRTKFDAWIKRRDEFLSLEDHEKNELELKSLRDCFHANVVKTSNVVTRALHDAFIGWVHQYTVRVENAKIFLKEHGKKRKREQSSTTSSEQGRKTSTNTSTEEATWPRVVCVNSPVEADDQLGYFHECGLIDIILTVDSDLIALGCFDIVTKGLTVKNNKSVPRGYTTKSVVDRAMQLFGIDKKNRDWRNGGDEFRRKYVRSLFCLLSCIVGNDYVKTALKPKPRASTKVSGTTTYAEDFVADFAKRYGMKQVFDDRLAFSLASEVWQTVREPTSSKQVAGATGILSYDTCDAYVTAFVKAFNIYHCGRRWEFEGSVPDIETFLRKDFKLVSAGMGNCDGLEVETSTMFINTTGEYEPRMIKDIDFVDYPVEALPLHVLRWWLLTRGIEVGLNDPHDLVMHRAKAVQDMPAIDPSEYKTTWSNLLQCMIGTTPRIPSVHWNGPPNKWTICSDKETAQKAKPLKDGLLLCKLEVNEQNLLSEKKMTEKEAMKSKRMSRDGQVMWNKFTMLEGRINLGGDTVTAIQYKLQCIPSMRSEVYPVNLVFVGGRSEHLQEEVSLSFCYCKRGAITSSLCSHRMAVRRWLHQLKMKWIDSGELEYVNFHDLANKLGVPPSVFHVSQLPIHLEPTLNTIRHTASTKSADWVADVESAVNKDNQDYLASALEMDEMEAKCKKYCSAILRFMSSGTS